MYGVVLVLVIVGHGSSGLWWSVGMSRILVASGRFREQCWSCSINLTALTQKATSRYCLLSSLLFFSRPRSKGWPYDGRTFSIYLCPL